MSSINKRANIKKGKNLYFPMAIIIAGIIIVAAILAIQFTQRETVLETPLVTPPDNSAAKTTKDIMRVSLDDALLVFDQESVVFLDVRDLGAYESKHIKGALSIPYNEITDRLDELSPDDWIIPYCS